MDLQQETEAATTKVSDAATPATKRNVLIVIVGAIVFTLLFHRQWLGLNLLFMELAVVGTLFWQKSLRMRGRNALTMTAGLLVTAVFTVLTHSIFAYVMHYITLFMFTGMLIYPETKSLLTSLGLAAYNFFEAPIAFIKALTKANVSGRSVSSLLWKSRIFSIPIVIILVFVYIYRLSNPVFDQLLNDIGNSIADAFTAVFQNVDALMIMTFLIGIVLLSGLFVRTRQQGLIDHDLAAEDALARRRNNPHINFKLNALKNEYRAGVFLLITLNAILLLVNAIDINWVWIHFDWQAQDLKQFVHEGTYLLILSILISIALVLYFFRGNLNFYKQNKWLKYLSYAWLIQNAILALSVGRRNLYYIDHFSLAYKRIGVIIFLILTLYGLATVFWKAMHGKSATYLFKVNTYSFYIILTLSSLFNWDTIIAQYNFAHADKSFLELEFMASLSDKALPYLDKSLEELKAIDVVQEEKFAFARDYMSPERYFKEIEYRKARFIIAWERTNILEWNLPEYLAYRALKAAP